MPGGMPGLPPKPKMPLATKIFLWVLAIACAGMMIAFTGVLVSRLAPLPWGNPAALLPGQSESSGDTQSGGEPDEWPDGDLPSDSQAPEAPPEKPDIKVTPNEEGILIRKKPSGAESTAEELYQKVVRSTVTVESTLYVEEYQQSTEPSTGTGIIATSDGYMITNSHVVLNSKNTDVKVITYDGQEYDAVVVGFDKTTDLAVLKTNDHNFTPAEFGDADELAIGEWVLAIGNPAGAQFSSSLTRGIISGLNRSVGQYSENGMTYIQTDAAINPGNSGGPLLNMYGQVVGINSSKIVSAGYEGMGFAIPVSKAQDIINELLSSGYVKGRTRLGIKGQDVSTLGYYMPGMPQGFMIQSLDGDSAFSGTDVQAGDIITEIDGKEVTGVGDIGNVLLGYKPGDKAVITLYRPNALGTGEGTTFTVKITLLEDKGETQG